MLKFELYFFANDEFLTFNILHGLKVNSWLRVPDGNYSILKSFIEVDACPTKKLCFEKADELIWHEMIVFYLCLFFLRQTSFKALIDSSLIWVSLYGDVFIYITLCGNNYESWKQFALCHGKTSSLSTIVSSYVLANKLHSGSGWNRWTFWNSKLYFNSTESFSTSLA